MFVEDLSAFFDPEGFGDDATYQRGAAAPVPVVVIMLRPSVDAMAGQLGVRLPSQQAMVAAAALPGGEPAENDVLTVAAGDHAGSYTVQTFRPDSTRRIWTLELSEPS